MRIDRFIAELKRRRVLRALVVWGIAAFAVLQVYEPVMHGLHLPDWTLSFVVVVLALGFPVVAALAWTFDITPSGIERTGALPADASVPSAPEPSRLRLVLLLLGLGVAAALPGVVYFFVWPGPARHAAGPQAQASGGRAAGAPSIAVLPFVNMSPDKDQEYFSDGISEEILNALAQVDGLRVIGRTSSFAMKGKEEDLRTIGQRLNAQNVLEGSVRRAGARVRITAQLIEATGGSHLWSQEFDRELTDVFAVQDEIARAVTAALRQKLLPAAPSAARAATAETSRSANPEAHDLYLRGMALMARGSGQGYEQARDALMKAVEKDPDFALAWASLARARFWSADQGSLEPNVEIPAAIAAADRAVALAPGLAEAWFARGFLKQGALQQWSAALADIERALSLSPGNADILIQHGSLLANLGRLPEAIPDLEKAVVQDPLSVQAHVILGVAHLARGEYPLGEASAARALELAPENARAARTLGFALLLQRRYSDARAAFHRSTNTLFSLMGDVMVDHSLGDDAASKRAMDYLLTLPGVAGGNYQVAQIYAWRGETDAAFEWLGKSADVHDAGLVYVNWDPFLAGLHGDRRWRTFLARLGLPVV